MKKLGRKRLIWFGVCAVLLVAAAACALGLRHISRSLLSQREDERWRGGNEMAFCQISCFLPADSEVGTSDIYSFRYSLLDEFTAAGIEYEGDNYPFIDAWSCESKLTISGDRGATAAPVTAVGGSFFEFHPLTLISGSYITENDISPDRVVLDRELAWELFGGVELAGMSVEVNGAKFVVAGVVDRESDASSRKAYTGEKGFYINYDAYKALTQKDAIGCYELVMPETVKNYAAQVVAKHFPLGSGESVVNSSRFSYGRLMGIAKDLPARAAHSGTVSYPYWENAARIAEDKCALLALFTTVFTIPAAVTLFAELIMLLVRGKRALENDLLPKAKDSVEEAVRVRARRRWEKKHNEKG